MDSRCPYELIFWKVFLFKHSSQISLTLYEHIAFMEAVDTFTKYGQRLNHHRKKLQTFG